MLNLTDEELMRRVQNDETEPLGVLFERYHNRLYGFLLRLHGDASTAEELVGETFWRVWQRRKQFQTRFYGWLFSIARSLALDDLRKGYRRESRFTDLYADDGDAMEEVRPGKAYPRRDDLLQRMAVRDQVQESLMRLPEEQRAAILLREYEGLSYEEIAEILGCTEGKARVLACRARAALRSLLLPLLTDEEDPCSKR